MIRKVTVTLCFMLLAVVLYAANKEQERLENCGVVMQEIMNIPDNIPQEVMEKAECVIVFPSAQGGVRGRSELWPWRYGLPHRRAFQGTVGLSSHVCARRWQRWIPDRRTSH
jgi:hypothetical protein